MKIYTTLRNGVPDENMAFTALKTCCEACFISYRAALKGKRKFIHSTSKGDVFVEIIELNIVKIKGRENNYKKKVATKQQAQQ